jgi:hypothetical protein
MSNVVRFPICVENNIGRGDYDKWKKCYKIISKKRDCSREEGLWRRTQDKENQELSGWKNDNDKRRRMIHYEHKFDVIKNKHHYEFFLIETYTWINLYLPEVEAKEYLDNAKKLLDSSNFWKRIKNKKAAIEYRCGDLFLKIKVLKKHPYDVKERRIFPKNYDMLEISVCSKGCKKNYHFKMKPWLVLKSGIRKKDLKGNPATLKNIDTILKYLPAQVEIGGGASIENGLPPLHLLHSIYSVSDQEKKFVFSWERDALFKNLITNPIESLENFSTVHKRIVKLKPNSLYNNLKKLHDSGHLVGPVITNNFDGFLRQVGLPELYVRKYSEKNNPHINFHKKAKSLIVIGVHADRRGIQKSARNKGLKVIYIDTEGFYENDGNFVPYPLESAQTNDIIIKLKAKDAVEKITAEVYKSKKLKKCSAG